MNNISLNILEKNCSGYFPSMPGKYVLCFNLSIGLKKIQLKSYGSTILDETNAFDLAEVKEANIGQTNMITVSSFCGPNGLIWGLDLFSQPKEILELYSTKNVKIYNAEPFFGATKRLLGTVHKPVFPIFPGSHILCASKSIKIIGPTYIYCSIAIAIPEDRNKNACLLMEDVGYVPIGTDVVQVKKILQENLIKSVVEIGKNQLINYTSVFIGIKYDIVPPDHVGCSLAMAPYLSLPLGFKEYLHDDPTLNNDTYEKILINNNIR